jgi:hypothetical protein
LRHNQAMTVAVVVVICTAIWIVGCQSTTKSPLNPDTKVTRAELEQEVEMFKVKVAEATADLDKQDAFKQELAQLGVALAQGGTIDPVGAVTTLVGILGLGIIVDNRKKDSIIKTLQNVQAQTTPVEAATDTSVKETA